MSRNLTAAGRMHGHEPYSGFNPRARMVAGMARPPLRKGLAKASQASCCCGFGSSRHQSYEALVSITPATPGIAPLRLLRHMPEVVRLQSDVVEVPF